MKLRNLKLAAALGLAGVLTLAAGQAQAGFTGLIDDMNFTQSSQASDSIVDGTADTAVRGIGGSGEWVRPNGTREGELYVNLISGDNATTEDCSNCKVGHTTNASSSTSHNYFLFESPDGSPLTFNAGDSIKFDYETDIDNGDFILSFSNNGSKVGDEFWWKDLAATGLSVLPGNPLQGTLSGLLTQTFDADGIFIDIFSNGGTYTDTTGWLGTRALGNAAIGLDINIDNLRVVPEPGVLGLMGLGLAGLAGWRRRRAG